jgi:hypothetical protein
MNFTLEPDVLLKESPASETTKKIYKSKLNALAKQGLATSRRELKGNAKKIKAYIESLYPDDEGGRLKKRLIVYAIFYAMDAAYLKKQNVYYKYLQTINPIKDAASGKAWLPIKEYRDKNKSETS